jgi:hypothetical protein
MEQEEDKVVAFKLVADLVEDGAHSCEVRPAILTCKQIPLWLLTVLWIIGSLRLRMEETAYRYGL